MNNKILIIPAAANKPIYKEHIPSIFKIDDNGYMRILNNMNGLPLDEFEHIYITINKEVCERYDISGMLLLQLASLQLAYKTDVIVIDNTKNVVETIIQTLENINLSHDYGVFIKDADAKFEINDIVNENTVYTYHLEDVSSINPSSKSYVTTTSDDIILNIIEKRVISSEFCAGGYFFNDVNKLIELCDDTSIYDKLYLSNVIYYDIIRNNELYRTESVNNFNE